MAVKRKGQVKIAFSDGNTNLYSWRTEINRNELEIESELTSRENVVCANQDVGFGATRLCFSNNDGIECFELDHAQFDTLRAFFHWYNEIHPKEEIHDVTIKLTEMWHDDKILVEEPANWKGISS